MAGIIDELIGSASVSSVLDNAVEQSRASIGTNTAGNDAAMTHSWLFTGPPGSGRTVAAKAFATALECTNPDVAGCGGCEQCKAVLAGTHPDVLWLSTEGMTIAVSDVRAVVSEAVKMPTVGKWRVIVVEDADRLNESAANALLKSVEEPAPHTIFILCAPSTDPQDIAITLRSRCSQVYIPIPGVEDVAQVLAADDALSLNDSQVQWASKVSGGHIGRARYLATSAPAREKRETALMLPELIYRPHAAYHFVDQLVKTAEQETDDALIAVNEKENTQFDESFGAGATGRGVAAGQTGRAGQKKELEKKQKNRRTRMIRDALDLSLMDIAALYRDALLRSVSPQESPELLHPDKAGTSQELANRQNSTQLLESIDAVMFTRGQLQHNVKPDVALCAMVGKIREVSDLH